MTVLSAAGAMGNPDFFGPYFSGDSWATWHAVLLAAEGAPLDDDQLTRFAAAADRSPPTCRVKELWVIAGRRAGKDSIASLLATVAALGDYRAQLRPGERATIVCLAVDREQARIVLKYIQGYFREIALLKPLVVRETPDGLELNNGVDVVVATNSFRAVRGRTIACAIFDEVAFWRSEESANPDIESYQAIIPGMVNVPGAQLIGISSPYRRSGLLFDRWRKHFGKDDDDVLVVKGPTRAFNPNVPQHIIDAALARDPEAARAEWLAEFRSDLSDFLDRALIEAAADPGVPVRPPRNGLRYKAFSDPSGGRGDSFSCAIAHAEGNLSVLDCLFERRPPFDPSAVVAEIAVLLRSYCISEVTGDKYAAEWVVEAFKKELIKYRSSDRDRSALYLDVLPLFTSGRARLIDNPRLVHQFATLERRTSRTGRDRVDHPTGSHDDLCNSAAGALLLASGKGGPLVIGDETLARSRIPMPRGGEGWSPLQPYYFPEKYHR